MPPNTTGPTSSAVKSSEKVNIFYAISTVFELRQTQISGSAFTGSERHYSEATAHGAQLSEITASQMCIKRGHAGKEKSLLCHLINPLSTEGSGSQTEF